MITTVIRIKAGVVSNVKGTRRTASGTKAVHSSTSMTVRDNASRARGGTVAHATSNAQQMSSSSRIAHALVRAAVQKGSRVSANSFAVHGGARTLANPYYNFRCEQLQSYLKICESGFMV